MGTRDRLARLLTGARLTEAALRLRSRVPVPYLTVITYHHVHDPAPDYPFDPDTADVTRAQFARHLDVLARHFTVIGIDELVGHLDGEPLPPNPVMITFDDGYRSCHDVALPMLQERGLRAVFFIPTWYVDERKLFWWERISWLASRDRTLDRARLVAEVKNTKGLDLPEFLDDLTRRAGVAWSEAVERRLADELLMTWDQVRAMADAGMDIESHTRTHRVLQTLSAAELDEELGGARRDLERALGRAPRTIAYPVGRSIANDLAIRDAIVRAGYRAGFTNASGTNFLGLVPANGRLDRFDIARVAVDRELSDPMFESQLAFPPLIRRARAIASKSNR